MAAAKLFSEGVALVSHHNTHKELVFFSLLRTSLDSFSMLKAFATFKKKGLHQGQTTFAAKRGLESHCTEEKYQREKLVSQYHIAGNFHGYKYSL